MNENEKIRSTCERWRFSKRIGGSGFNAIFLFLVTFSQCHGSGSGKSVISCPDPDFAVGQGVKETSKSIFNNIELGLYQFDYRYIFFYLATKMSS